MFQYIRVNLLLLALTLLLCSVLYPLVLLVIGQTLFPHQAEGSLIDEDGNPVTSAARARGSRLIAQPFKGDEYFQPRPSNAGSNGYDASASGASNWGASNPLLRSRVTRQLGPMVKYADDPRNRPRKRGRFVARDIEAWFQGRVKKDPNYVVRWAEENSALAEQWVKDNSAVVATYLKKSKEEVNGDTAAASKGFWKKYANAEATRGTWPTVEDKTVDGKPAKVLVPATTGPDVQGFFFDPWLQDRKHRNVVLEKVPADMVMSSGSGLDPHITLDNARYQLKHRVAQKQAETFLKAHPEVEEQLGRASLEKRIAEAVDKLLEEKKEAPLGGLVGVDLINVLEVNLAMQARLKKLEQELP